MFLKITPKPLAQNIYKSQLISVRFLSTIPRPTFANDYQIPVTQQSVLRALRQCEGD